MQKTTLLRQCVNMVCTHLAACGITAIFIFIAFWVFMFEGIWDYVMGIVFLLVYFGMIYSASKRQQERDRRGFTVTGVNKKKGFLFGGVLCAVMLVIYILYKMSWALMSMNGMIVTATGHIYNFLFGFWNMPIFASLDTVGGNAQWYIMIFMYIAAFSASVLGYYAGIKNYNISERIDQSMYEKKDK